MMLLGQKRPKAKESTIDHWLAAATANEYLKVDIPKLTSKYPEIKTFLDRGIISPALAQIQGFLTKLEERKHLSPEVINPFLLETLSSLEQMMRRAFILELNISSISNNLNGNDKSSQYIFFVKSFESEERRRKFYETYPVLFRKIYNQLDLWSIRTLEFLCRLKTDRIALKQNFNIGLTSKIISCQTSGDTHNEGRAVMILNFHDGGAVVYKPRSTSLEEGFQEYIDFFNSVYPDLKLRRMKVLSRNNYGWVEYVQYGKQKSALQSQKFHFRLGFLTSIVYSIGGVDIFFENLISAGDNPVIIDLETMFHTFIDTRKELAIIEETQLKIHSSIVGIGVLPLPNAGTESDEIFDISVLGAKKNAKAPYKVDGIENFGLSDMRITKVPGWIPENKANSEDDFPEMLKRESLLSGIQAGLNTVIKYKNELGKEDGVVDKCFAGAKRRLIVRDTKSYGTLQNDEAHPDLLKDQIDREWHWDNLWGDINSRPNLEKFIHSELQQLKLGDIPYFAGPVDSFIVRGSDGSVIDIADIARTPPLQQVKSNLNNLQRTEVENQVRIAATVLGFEKANGITQPDLEVDARPIDNAISIAHFIQSRTIHSQGYLWLDTTINPTPEARRADSVRIVPCDPFLYEGTSGLILFFYELWKETGTEDYLSFARKLADSTLKAIEEEEQHTSISGFTGLASIVYVINKCSSNISSEFEEYEEKLTLLTIKILGELKNEKRVDFLTGVSGAATALIPYTRRTSSDTGTVFLENSAKILIDVGKKLLQDKKNTKLLSHTKGLSHGISGISLGLYRLAEHLGCDEALDLSRQLQLRESELVLQDGWTQNQRNGAPLVAWCHGSAGISLALSCMPKLLKTEKRLRDYFDRSVSNTINSKFYNSHCLCHGAFGNQVILEAIDQPIGKLDCDIEAARKALLTSGFASFGAAQTLSIGLMTGLSGLGLYFLSKSSQNSKKFDFLSLK